MTRFEGTAPEQKLKMCFWRRKVIIQEHLPVMGSPDLGWMVLKIAIFVDGCFWHGCDEHYRAPKTRRKYWNRMVKKQQQRDRDVSAELIDSGWLVLRYWEHQIKEDAEGVADEIMEHFKAKSS